MLYGRFRQFVFWAALAIPFAYALNLYPSTTKMSSVHFNTQGEPDNWNDPINLFVVPFILGVSGFFVCSLISNIRRIDPKRYGDFDDSLFRQIGMFTQIFLCSLSLIYLYTTTHQQFTMQKLVPVLLGLFFSAFGIYLPKSKPNSIAGFRLPWTNASDSNWISTHLLAGKLWVIGGLLLLPASILLDGADLVVTFVLIISASIVFPTIHSYLFFRREKNRY
jgi:hypothetical protein